MRRTSMGDDICPVARSLDEIGDWWTILIVRDAFHGKKRFSEFQQSLGLAKNILSARLRKLIAHGIVEKRMAYDASARGEYHLTEKGRQLVLVLSAIRQWGEDHLFTEGERLMVARDRMSRPIARLRLMDQDGRPLTANDMIVTPGRKSTKSGLKRTRRARGL
jgi:DNA-binding HxlR family transcriptional regulator